MLKTLILGLGVIIVAAVGWLLFSDGGVAPETIGNESADVMEEKDMEDAMVNAGSDAGTYEAYAPEKLARANTGDVVLFFRASWCPTCRGLDADIRAHSADIPKGLTILDIDYDTEMALKQKYGITYQHTFVQVDAEGNSIARWQGSPTLAAFLENVR